MPSSIAIIYGYIKPDGFAGQRIRSHKENDMKGARRIPTVQESPSAAANVDVQWVDAYDRR